MTEINEVASSETCHGKEYFPINISPEANLPTGVVGRLKGKANTELIVLD
jgi:hypothetical protein|tara:strand:+ start:241 stop:390 length:150 start_codon:yes stop_codon:yes gene_type:complete